MGEKRIIVPLLIIVAVVVGYSLYQNFRPSVTPSPAEQTVTEEQRRVASQPPGPRASEAERAAYFELITKLARDGTAIDVTDCVNNPRILRIQNGTTLTLRNNGATPTAIDLEGEKHVVAAYGSKQVAAGFRKGPGVFGYGCNSVSGETGGASTGSGLIIVTD